MTEEDLEVLSELVDMKDGGPPWIQMMDRSTPTMTYQGWRRDPKVMVFPLTFAFLVNRFVELFDFTIQLFQCFVVFFLLGIR